MNSKFIHLHVHSHYSLLQALPKIDELVERAKAEGMEAIALTDYGAMYGAIEFLKECKKAEIKPIIGVETYLAKYKRTDRRPRIDDRPYQIVLLAETLDGYKNMMRLMTDAHLEGFYYKPRVDKETLRQYHEGVICLSGGLKGEINQALVADDWEKAESLVREYTDIFGKESFFLELVYHPEMDEQNARNADLITLAKKTGAHIVATRDVHYLASDDNEAHDTLICVGIGKTVDEDDHRRMLGVDYSFTTQEQMITAFAETPEAIENTVTIAERCNVPIELGKWNFADFPVPEGKTHADVLRDEAYAGLAKKVSEVTEEITARMEYELDIIAKKGYAPYFLVVSDYVRWSKAQGIFVTTRGSAAGSLVSYCIDIVSVNPMDFKLPFERFLNPFRPSPPDIDVDFADERRDEVIAYVTEKYGADRVAQIGTFGTLGPKAVVRDVGRALGYPYALCDKVAKLIPLGSQGFHMSIDRAIKETPALVEMIETDPRVRRLIDLAKKMEGCARHMSVHAAGVVIAPRQLTDFVPLQREAGGDKIITQYDWVAVEDAGVLKMDFLGIRNLSILEKAVKIVKQTKGVDIDLQTLPFDDEKTFALLAEGDTTGLFQLGGTGMTRYLKELKPTNIFDIMAMVALFRPGPMESIPEFIRRKHNPKLITHLDPRLKDILSMSYGVMTYQDDVLLTAIGLAGYNWEEADKLRKAMGKKIPAEMAKQKDKFLTGCVKGGLTQVKADTLWHLIEPFAAYGFNKAHAASYAVVAYHTAYLKAHFPAEFMTAVLTAESDDADKVGEIVTECTKLGMTVLPPDVNSSLANFTYIDDTHIRFGLLAIKNVGSDIVATIITERKANGPYVSIADMAARVASKNFNKKSLEALVKSGAMDGFGERNQLLAGTEQILSYHKDAVRDQTSGQSTLFAGSPLVHERVALVLRDVPPATKREKLAWERELLGLYVSEHPFHEYGEYFSGLLLRIIDIGHTTAGSSEKGLARVGGIIMDARKIMTKNNEPMAFVKLEDETGTIEVVVFPSIYKKNPDVWVKDVVVLVEGKYNVRDGESKVLCESVTQLTSETMPVARQSLLLAKGGVSAVMHDVGPGNMIDDTAHIFVAVPPKMPPTFAEELKRTFGLFPGNRRVFLAVKDGETTKKIETSFSIAFSGDAITAIEKLVGRGAVQGTMQGAEK